MRASDLRAALRLERADQRAGVLAMLRTSDAEEHELALFGALVGDPSVNVRVVAETVLARRRPDVAIERPVPRGLAQAGSEQDAARVALVTELARDEAGLAELVGALAATSRGRDLLAHVSLEQAAIDDAVLDLVCTAELACTAEPAVVADLLAMPIDGAGRLPALLDRLAEHSSAGRDAIVKAWVHSAMQNAGITSDHERARAEESFLLWAQGLLSPSTTAATDALAAPTYADFIKAGGKLAGIVTAQVPAPAETTLAALADLARAVHLHLVKGRFATLLPEDREPLLEATRSAHPDLRAVAWRLLARAGLVTPEQLVDAALAETQPGVARALLDAVLVARTDDGTTAAELPPHAAPRVLRLFDHRRASVRRGAAEVLARSPLVAGIAAASIDPRSQNASLAILGAQAPALAAPALQAYLTPPPEVKRTPAQLVAALARLERPPQAAWAGFSTLLRHEARRVRRAAYAALLRLPSREAPTVIAFLPRVLADEPPFFARLVDHFGLGATHRDDLAKLLLDESVDDATATTIVKVLARDTDPRAWDVLWKFITGATAIGEAAPKRRRFGTRASRRVASEALLDVAPPAVAPRPVGPTPSRADVEPLAALLADRDPEQRALALRWMAREGVPTELAPAVENVLAALTIAPLFSRRFRAAVARFFRRVLPKGWVAPPARTRTDARALTAPAFELAARFGAGRMPAHAIATFVSGGAPATPLDVRRAAARLYVTLPGARPLRELALTGDRAAVLEAVRVAHPDEVEALVIERLVAGARGRIALQTELEWIEARPRPTYVPLLGRLLHDATRRTFAARALRAVQRSPEGAGPVRSVAIAEVARTIASEDDALLAQTVELLTGLELWELAPRLVPAIAWAREATRQRLVDLLRRARERDVGLDAKAIAPLLEHPLADVRLLALGFLRATGGQGLWEAVRPYAPGEGNRSPEYAKAFLGTCEDQWDERMGLAVEGCLDHANAEVARRALKLLNQKGREVATLALLEHLDDPELRQPILTTFSTWGTRFLSPAAKRGTASGDELLENARRELRATIEGLATGPRARATALIATGVASANAFVRGAALFAIGRLGLEDARGHVAGALGDRDPVIARIAAFAAGCLAAKDEAETFEARLRALASAREPELRATARRALVRRLDPERAGDLESALSDPAPEVRRAVLDACLARPSVLAHLALEARLGDPAPQVRALVLRALARRGSGQPAALRGALADPLVEVRLAAIEVVRAWGRGAAEELREDLALGIADPSIHVAGAVLDLLRDVKLDLAWAVPQLVHAVEAGHRSHRSRVLALVGRLDATVLEAEPVRAAFLRLFASTAPDDQALVRGVGRLVARRGLAAYAPELVRALRGPHRRHATRWLRGARFARPVAALRDLALDASAPLEARTAALRLLPRELARDQAERLLPALAVSALQSPLFRLLKRFVPGPEADALIAKAALANAEHGRALANQTKVSPGAEDALGACANVAHQQRPFTDGIVKLAIEARSGRWLLAAHERVFEGGPSGGALADAIVSSKVVAVGDALVKSERAWASPQHRAITIELLGRLGVRDPRIGKALATLATDAPAEGDAALVALARLGERDAIKDDVEGALAVVSGGFVPPGSVRLRHGSSHAAALRAGAIVGTNLIGDLAITKFNTTFAVDPAVLAALPEILVATKPLQLVPSLDRMLAASDAPRDRREMALAIVKELALRELLPRVVEVPKLVSELTDHATDVATALLTKEDAALAQQLVASATPSDGPLERLLARAHELFERKDRRKLARAIVERGASGPRAQRRALRWLRALEKTERYAATIARLLGRAGPLRRIALGEAARLGLLPRRGELVGTGPGADLACHDVVRLAADALEGKTRPARGELRVLLDALAPPSELKRRLRKVAVWSSQTTFHAMHRELLALGRERPELGPLHGGLLLVLSRSRFQHPKTGKQGPYEGPLARLDETFASESPYVQDALYDLVASEGYRRTERLVVRFLSSPRARVRRSALATLGRDATLAHAPSLLALLRDPDATVRAAMVERLRELDLARFSDEVRPLLEDRAERVRLVAARALATWGDPSCVRHLAAFLKSGGTDEALRKEAVQALRKFPVDALAGVLAPLVRLETPRDAAAALACLRPEQLPRDPALADAIFAIAARGAGPLRALAVRFLPALASPQRLGDFVPLLADRDDSVRAAVSFALRRRDGRRHAPAIADLAARTEDSALRREMLALLRDLGVAEAARALVPLLLDDDALVRAAAREAIVAPRGFSLLPELTATLARALEGGCAPVAVKELVELLDRVGGDDALVAIGSALRCEQRPVWEAVVRVARARESDAHVGRMVELLAATPSLPAPLLTLALAEVGRANRKDALPQVERIAREATVETVQRKALEVALALSGDAGSLAQEVASQAVKRAAPLEKDLAEKVGKKVKPTKDEKRPLRRVRGTLGTAARVAVASARTGDAVGAAVASLPAEALRGHVPGVIVSRAADVLVEEGRLGALRGALAKLPPGARTRRGQTPQPARDRVGWLVRDRVAAGAWLARLREVAPEKPEAFALAQVRARLLAGESLSLDEHRAALAAVPDESGETFYVSLMESWRPELLPLFGEVVAHAKKRIDALPDDRWGGKARQAVQVGDRLAKWRKRIGVDEGRAAILELVASQLTIKHRVLAADDDVAELARSLETKQADRREVLGFLGEVGGPEAARVASTWAKDSVVAVRAAAAEALGRSRAPEAAREALAALLADRDESVLVPALEAIGRLRLAALTTEVVAHVLHASQKVVLAAIAALGRIDADVGRAAVSALLTAQPPKAPQVREAAAKLLERIADETSVATLVTALELDMGPETSRALEAALLRVTPVESLDDVGRLLVSRSVRAAAAAARILGARGHAKALPALRELVSRAEPLVREAACQSLGALGDRASEPLLRARLVVKDETEPRVRAAALEALARLATDEPARRKLFLDALADASAEVMQAAATGLAALGPEPATARALLERLVSILAPGLELPREGEDLASARARIAAVPLRRLDVAQRAAAKRLLSAFTVLDDPVGAFGGALACHLAMYSSGWTNDADLLRAVEPWFARAPHVLPVRLDDLVASGHRDTSQVGVEIASRVKPLLAVAFGVREARATYSNAPHAVKRAVAIAARLARAGDDAWRGFLRETLLSADAEARRIARAGLDPSREQEEAWA